MVTENRRLGESSLRDDLLPKTGSLQDEQDGDLGYKSALARPSSAWPAGDSVVIDEVMGEVSSKGSEAAGEAHAEVQYDAGEAGEEFAEASPEQMAASVGEESSIEDLRSIEGFEEGRWEEAAGTEVVNFMPEAGTAIEGGEEFLPFLAGLAAKVIPLLATVGPTVARSIPGKMGPRARSALSKPREGTDIVAVIQRLLAQAMKRAEGAAEEAIDESVVEEIAQTLEVVIGADDRVRIPNTDAALWQRYCALRIEFPSGAVYRGTGFFIGRRTVATAGHCVYLHNQGGWARRIEVIPGCNGTERPLGSAKATTFRSTAGWTKERIPAADYGAILLPDGAFKGKNLGSFGFGVFQTNILLAKPVVLAGYPGDKPFAQLWGMSRRIKTVTTTQLVYDIDSMGGQSGAPVYLKNNGKRYVVGIHNYGASTGNSATRVTEAVAENFRRWSKANVPAAAPAPVRPLAMAGADS
ncbi:trypsin-like serine protease [Frankia sp. EAN1pec]|uniref:trypsin-like serine protease n=1 Tax=Parafrankia sp. (strain EAN1pec) TaxID=298653 RepID=UPI0000544086